MNYKVVMTKQLKNEQKEQNIREIEKSVSRFSEHLMSDSKWVRLISGLIKSADKIKKIEFRKVQNKQRGELYINSDTKFNFDYWQNGFEGNNSLGGWITFKEIEYLVFPKIVNKEAQLEQDLGKIKEIIESIGLFSLDMDDNRIKLICYRE